MQQLDKKTRIQDFYYQTFLLIIENIQQKQGSSNQQLFNEFKCTIVSHKNKQIVGICINQECKAQNRRKCYDCIIKNIHIKDEQSNKLNNCNPDQLSDVIKQYKIFINQQIDCLEYSFYFEQLQLTIRKNNNVANQQLQVLQKIDIQIQQQKHLIDKISIQEYIQQQHKQNIGIYQFLYKNYNQIKLIDNNLEDYIQFKNELNNFQNIEDDLEISHKEIEELQDVRKKKHLIVKNIIGTQIYQIHGMDKEDKLIIQNQTQDLYEQGKRLYIKQQYELALQYFDLQIFFNSNDNDAYLFRGNTLKNLKRYEEAIQMYDKAIQLNPQYSNAYFNKGNSIRYLKRYEEAIQMYDKAIKLNPQYSKAYNNKGNSLHYLKRYEQAIQMYDKAIHLNHQYSEAYFNKGNSLRQLKRYEEAIQMQNKAIQLNPRYSKAYFNKGFTLKNLKRDEEAEQSFIRAKEFQNQK